MQQKLISCVIYFEQLRSDLHARVDARFTVELQVGVEDSSVEVFDALDDAFETSGSLMLAKAQLHDVVTDKPELP